MAEKLTKIEKLSFIPEEFDIPNYLHITEAINQARVNGFKFTSCKKNKSEVAGTGRKLSVRRARVMLDRANVVTLTYTVAVRRFRPSLGLDQLA